MGNIILKVSGSFIYIGESRSPLIAFENDEIKSVNLSQLIIIDTNIIKHFKLFLWIIKVFTKRSK